MNLLIPDKEGALSRSQKRGKVPLPEGAPPKWKDAVWTIGGLEYDSDTLICLLERMVRGEGPHVARSLFDEEEVLRAAKTAKMPSSWLMEDLSNKCRQTLRKAGFVAWEGRNWEVTPLGARFYSELRNLVLRVTRVWHPAGDLWHCFRPAQPTGFISLCFAFKYVSDDEFPGHAPPNEVRCACCESALKAEDIPAEKADVPVAPDIAKTLHRPRMWPASWAGKTWRGNSRWYPGLGPSQVLQPYIITEAQLLRLWNLLPPPKGEPVTKQRIMGALGMDGEDEIPLHAKRSHALRLLRRNRLATYTRGDWYRTTTL